MGSRESIVLMFLILISTYGSSAKEGIAEELNEEFTEGLLLRPLPDRKVLAHFHFQSSVPPTRIYGRHHHLFPKSIYQLGFLHIDEYPPDANQGFDIPSAVVSFTDAQASIGFEDNLLNKLPIMNELQERKHVISYTEVLLVPLTTPDFSMPYNVITITCTVFALYFGSLLNALRRRVGEEERRLKSKAAKKRGPLTSLLSKLSAKVKGRPIVPPETPSTSPSLINNKLVLKVILVAGIAAGWQYYFR